MKFILFAIINLIFLTSLQSNEIESPFVYNSVNVITGEYTELQADLKVKGKKSGEIKRIYRSNGNGWEFNFPLNSDSEKGKVLFAQINSNDESCQILTDHGQELKYIFENSKKNQLGKEWLITDVIKNGTLLCHYDYQPHPREQKKVITKRTEPNGNYLINEYYTVGKNKVGNQIVEIKELHKDPRIGKVKLQKAPVGPDGEAEEINRFIYYDGFTEVYDASGNKRIYRYNKNLCLTDIEFYLADDQLLRKERYFWNTNGQLIGKVLEDNKGLAEVAYAYEYNKTGNISRHTLYGNLSGPQSTSFSINNEGRPKNSKVESYTVEHFYSSDDLPRLIKDKEQNGKEVCYEYSKAGDLIGKLEKMNGKIERRLQMSYDDDHLLIETHLDCGSEQKTIKTQFHKDGVLYGLPHEVLELSNNKLLKSTIYTYDEKGNPIKEEIYGPNGQKLSNQEVEYDHTGRPISIKDKDDHTLQTFHDEANRMIQVISTLENGKTTEKNQYFDQANRLIQETVKDENDHITTSRYAYDAKGNKISSWDTYENCTHYTYDALGRLIATIYPETLDEMDCAGNSMESFEYDNFDRLSTKIDPRGYSTKIQYTARGKPARITHPDGTSEIFEYHLDGTLKKKQERNGNSIEYVNDAQDNLTRETHYSSSGKIVKDLHHTYKGSKLTSTTDHKGNILKKEFSQEGTLDFIDNGTLRTEFTYTENGQILTRKEYSKQNPNQFSLMTIERDSEGKILQTTIHDNEGTLLKVIKENPKQQQETLHTSHRSVQNALGQNVSEETTTDAKGNLITITKDALGRVNSMIKKNSIGCTLQSIEYRYDRSGNKARETHAVYGKGQSYDLVNSWEYGPEGRVLAMHEAVGSSVMKSTLYEYDQNGRLQSLIKPDGVVLTRAYNTTGQLETLISSDNTVHYRYGYDHDGKMTSVTDMVYSQTTARKYSSEGNLIGERLGNGLTIQYAYDHFGRKTEMHLPDHSYVAFLYDPLYLREVKRYTKTGEEAYSHYYDKYDTNGKLLESSMIYGIGKIVNTRNENGNLISIKAPEWSQNLEWNEGKITSVTINDISGSHSTNYGYDHQGRLTYESGNESHDYDYDSLSNRLAHNDTPSTFNELNQLITKGDHRYVYDRNGNLIEEHLKDNIRKMTYDALNRLISIEIDGVTTKMINDPFNRRITKITNDTTTEHYLYDGDNEIATVNKDGGLETLRILGLGMGCESGATIAIETDGRVFAPIHDHRGSIVALIDDQKNCIECYRYDAFGNELESTSVSRNPWRYSGKRLDADTGLIYFGQRYYDPKIGRWLTQDPLGFPDGPNRYAYLNNEPLTQMDLYGLFSFSDVWDTLVRGVTWFFDSFHNCLTSLQNKYSFSSHIKPDFEKFFKVVFGNYLLHMSGFYDENPETGVFGGGELNEKVRITLINGILNARCDFVESLDLVSSTHGGNNVHYIFRPTLGFTWDIIKSFAAKVGYITPQAQQLAETWKKLIADMGGVDGGGLIIHYAHSIGGTDTYAAKHLLTAEEQKMIRVVTFGSATMIPNNGFQNVINYISRRDGICFIDPICFIQSFINDFSHIIYLSSSGPPFFDHFINGETYAYIIQCLGKEFLELIESLK